MNRSHYYTDAELAEPAFTTADLARGALAFIGGTIALAAALGGAVLSGVFAAAILGAPL